MNTHALDPLLADQMQAADADGKVDALFAYRAAQQWHNASSAAADVGSTSGAAAGAAGAAAGTPYPGGWP